MNDMRLLTIKESAAELGIAATKLRPLIDTPDGPRSFPWGNEKRIPAWELRRWQEERLSAIDRKVDALLKSAGINKSKNKKERVKL